MDSGIGPNETTTLAGVREEHGTIHSYEVDFNQRATLESVCRRFLEAAWNHAEQLGVGFGQLARQDKFWVLSRLLVRVERSPRWGEKVRLRTWPRQAESIFAMRHFELADARGAPLVRGVSAWLVLDARTRRPQRLEKLLSSIPVLPDQRALEIDPAKLPAPEPSASPAPQTALGPVAVRYTDIDVNQHVTSARYIGWILDAYPLEFHRDHWLRLLELNYLGETRGGESISVTTQPSALGSYTHSIFKSGIHQEVCRARAEWVAHPSTAQPAIAPG